MVTATARHILVDSEEKCLELKERIEAGEEFTAIAREYSSCPSRAQGGDLGRFGPGMMVPEFDKVVFSAAVNSLQGPVKTQFGYHLLEVTDRSE
ncbi:MAG: peptidylprolyl isomerase [Gammaproteobacteria bacterium]|nr:peptidylprolyl isomerase [Pseudomonadales bacterium]